MYTSALVMFIGRDDVCVSLNGFAQNIFKTNIFLGLQNYCLNFMAQWTGLGFSTVALLSQIVWGICEERRHLLIKYQYLAPGIQ